MKVCHITSVHRYDDTRIFIKECQSLAQYYETHLVAVDAPNRTENGVHIHGVDKASGGRLNRMTITVKNVFKKALEIDADVYHFHDPELILIGLLLKRKRKKVIYDVHEDVPRQLMSKDWLPKIVRKLISRSFEILENYASQKFSAVIVATPHIRDRFRKIRKDAIDINNYPILAELQVAHNDWSKKEKAVCYVGVINRIRGIFEMVEGAGQTNAQLLLGGKFVSENDYKNVTDLEGWKNVSELGHLSRKEMAEVLSKSCAGLVLFHPLPNHIDAQPNKMFEYMSSGIPVIASDFSLWREIIEGNNSGICVDPLNPNEIAKAVNQLTSNVQEAKRMGENGRKAVESKYNWDKESEKLIRLYQTL
jgi:glycosyltransferase involved in cell wall biosynthesis